VRGVELVDQEVDDDAGDGNVEPEGQGPAGQETVLIEELVESAAQSDDDEWNDRDGQDGVGYEDGEIEGTDPALALEMNDLVNAHMVDHVGHQESAGDAAGGEHEEFVDVTLAGPDGGVAGGEENGARPVEDSVERGMGHGRRAFRSRIEDNNQQTSVIR